jgi:NYN domain
MPTANVYIDGFNLYYGCLKGTRYRWLNLGAFAKALLPATLSVHSIRYYTARVSGLARDPLVPRRQEIYLRALAMPSPAGRRFVRVIKTEEKGSDVNLASHLLVDAFTKDCEVAFVVSNDSDLLEPIRNARRRLGVTVGLASPYKRVSKVLAAEVDFVRPIWPRTLERCQFPRVLVESKGSFSKPEG